MIAIHSGTLSGWTFIAFQKGAVFVAVLDQDRSRAERIATGIIQGLHQS